MYSDARKIATPGYAPRSLSEYLIDVRAALAVDAEDIAAFEERANEPLISFSEMLKRLKKDGRI